MNKFLKEFRDRGYFYQCTNKNELSDLLDKKSINAYIGFDSTAASLHVGSLMQIMCLRLLQNHGHRPIVLLGGGTTRIGDPSGKEETRKILSEKQIEQNIKNIQNVFKILSKLDEGVDVNKILTEIVGETVEGEIGGIKILGMKDNPKKKYTLAKKYKVTDEYSRR